MAAALGNARPRGRGRLKRGSKMPMLPKNAQAPKLGPGGLLPPPQRQINASAQGSRSGAMGRGRRDVGAGMMSASRKGSVSGAALPGPGGRQLAAKLASGAITGEQAQKTMRERQTLRKALGSDFREKLKVDGKSFAEVNKGLKVNPQDPTLVALRKKLLANRSSLVESARAKNKGAKQGAEKESEE